MNGPRFALLLWIELDCCIVAGLIAYLFEATRRMPTDASTYGFCQPWKVFVICYFSFLSFEFIFRLLHDLDLIVLILFRDLLFLFFFASKFIFRLLHDLDLIVWILFCDLLFLFFFASKFIFRLLHGLDLFVLILFCVYFVRCWYRGRW